MNLFPIAASAVIIAKGLSGLYLLLKGVDLFLEGHAPLAIPITLIGVWMYVTAWPNE